MRYLTFNEEKELEEIRNKNELERQQQSLEAQRVERELSLAERLNAEKEQTARSLAERRFDADFLPTRLELETLAERERSQIRMQEQLALALHGEIVAESAFGRTITQTLLQLGAHIVQQKLAHREAARGREHEREMDEISQRLDLLKLHHQSLEGEKARQHAEALATLSHQVEVLRLKAQADELLIRQQHEREMAIFTHKGDLVRRVMEFIEQAKARRHEERMARVSGEEQRANTLHAQSIEFIFWAIRRQIDLENPALTDTDLEAYFAVFERERAKR